MDKGGDGATKVQERVQFDGTLGGRDGAEGNSSDRVDGRGVQRVNGRVEGEGEGFVRVKLVDARSELASQSERCASREPLGVGERPARRRAQARG